MDTEEEREFLSWLNEWWYTFSSWIEDPEKVPDDSYRIALLPDTVRGQDVRLCCVVIRSTLAAILFERISVRQTWLRDLYALCVSSQQTGDRCTVVDSVRAIEIVVPDG